MKRRRSPGGWVLQARVAAALAGLYLVLFLAAFFLPLLTGEALAGLWAYLLAIPWSDALPVAALDRVHPALTGIVGPALIFAGGILNALLLYLGGRWIESSVRGGPAGDASPLPIRPREED